MSTETQTPATEVPKTETPKSTLVETFSLFESIVPTTAEYHRVTGRRTKNMKKDDPAPILDVVKIILPAEDFYVNLCQIVGNGDVEVGENLIRGKLVEVINEATEDALEESYSEDGNINPVKLETNFIAQFQPSSRRKSSGLKKKEITQRKAELTIELTDLFNEVMANGGSMSEEIQNKLAQIQLELAKLNEAEIKKARRGEKVKPVTK